MLLYCHVKKFQTERDPNYRIELVHTWPLSPTRHRRGGGAHWDAPAAGVRGGTALMRCAIVNVGVYDAGGHGGDNRVQVRHCRVRH